MTHCYIPIKVYVNDILLCTVPKERVEGMLRHLKSKGLDNVTTER